MNDFLYLSDVVTLQLDALKCNGCRMCMDVCPHAVFAMDNGKAKIVRRDYCMECGACAMNCARKAITVQSGVGCAAGIINGILRNTEPTCGCSETGSGCC
ncbi:MAG: mercury methylation ferredoxin HgcB [Bacteroidales bacterium]